VSGHSKIESHGNTENVGKRREVKCRRRKINPKLFTKFFILGEKKLIEGALGEKGGRSVGAKRAKETVKRHHSDTKARVGLWGTVNGIG